MIVHAEPFPSLLAVKQKIDFIEIFICPSDRLHDYPATSGKASTAPRAIWLHLYGGGWSGWASCPLPSAYRGVDALHWAAVFTSWKGLSAEECLIDLYLRHDSRDMVRKELAKFALLNMLGTTVAYNKQQHEQLMDEAVSYCYYRIN